MGVYTPLGQTSSLSTAPIVQTLDIAKRDSEEDLVLPLTLAEGVFEAGVSDAACFSQASRVSLDIKEMTLSILASKNSMLSIRTPLNLATSLMSSGRSEGNSKPRIITGIMFLFNKSA